MLVEGLNSKMAATMAAKTLKDLGLYLSSELSYKDKWGVDFYIFNDKNLITRSDNSVRMLQSKMAANMAAITLKNLYRSSQVSYKDK